MKPNPGGTVVAFPGRQPGQVGFTREELQRILDLYGRMVAAGEWRDYAMDFNRDSASFAAFRRTAYGLILAAAVLGMPLWDPITGR